MPGFPSCGEQENVLYEASFRNEPKGCQNRSTGSEWWACELAWYDICIVHMGFKITDFYLLRKLDAEFEFIWPQIFV